MSTALAHEDDSSRAELIHFLGGGTLRFGASESRVRFRRSDFERPLLTRNEPLFEFLDHIARSQQRERRAVLSQLVEERLQQLLARQETTVSQVARSLHMSARTLQRRLAAEGVVYGELSAAAHPSTSVACRSGAGC